MTLDEAIHCLYANMSNIRWRSFPDVSFDDWERDNLPYDYYSYYYAENELYVIRDNIRDDLYLVKARSPYQAFIKFEEHTSSCMGGEYRGRDFGYEDFVKLLCANCVHYDDCDRIPIDENGGILYEWRDNCRDFEEVDE